MFTKFRKFLYAFPVCIYRLPEFQLVSKWNGTEFNRFSTFCIIHEKPDQIWGRRVCISLVGKSPRIPTSFKMKWNIVDAITIGSLWKGTNLRFSSPRVPINCFAMPENFCNDHTEKTIFPFPLVPKLGTPLIPSIW